MGVFKKAPCFTVSKGRFPCRMVNHQVLVQMLGATKWWAKQPTWKLTLSLQHWLWYHEVIDSATTHVPDFEC